MAENKMFTLMKSCYANVVSIQEELGTVNIENFLEFNSVMGSYEFYKCSGCMGPQLGHIAAKCTKIPYESDTVRQFEVYLKEIKGFKEALWKREEEKEKRKVEAKVAAAAQAGNAGIGAAAGGVTQVVKARPPPLWSGQKYER